MDLMNAMIVPAAKEAPRSSAPRRKDQDEPEPMVSFPTMLEQSARLEKAPRAKGDAPGTESSTQKPAESASRNVPGESMTDTGTETGVPADKPATLAPAAAQVAPEGPVLAAEPLPVGSQGTAATTEINAAPETPSGEADISIPTPENSTQVSVEAPPADAGDAAETTGKTSATGGEPMAVAGNSSAKEGESAAAGPEVPPALKAVQEESVQDLEIPEESEVMETDAPAKTVEKAETAARTAPIPESESDSDTDENMEIETEESVVKMSAAEGGEMTGENPEDAEDPQTDGEAKADSAVMESNRQASLIHAQRSYQQPQASQPQQEPKVTLADLDLDSGSLDSFLSRDGQSAALSSLTSQRNTPQIKSAIHSQVSRSVVEHLRTEMAGEKITLRLNPEELGQVEINFHALDDKLTISMSAEGRHAEKALQEGSRELADHISEKTGRFNLVEVRVETRQQQQGRQENRPQDDGRERNRQQQDTQQQGHQGRQGHHSSAHTTGAGEWAAFHLGG